MTNSTRLEQTVMSTIRRLHAGKMTLRLISDKDDHHFGLNLDNQILNDPHTTKSSSTCIHSVVVPHSMDRPNLAYARATAVRLPPLRYHRTSLYQT